MITTVRDAPVRSVTAPARRSRGRLVVTGVLVVAFALLVLTQPRFLTPENLGQLLLAAAILAVVACGQALVVLTRQIDLSVGSMVGLTAYLTSDLLRAVPGLPVPPAFGFAVVVGAALGGLNAVLVVLLGIPAIIATLAMLAVYRGVLFLLSDGGAITANEVPDNWVGLMAHSVWGLPIAAWIALVVCAAGSVWLRTARSGRAFYATGSNRLAAEAAGIRTTTVLCTAFAVSGALCGLAGAMWSSLYGSVESGAATGYELLAVAAVVVGGVAVTGGRGTLWGAGLGGLFLIAVTNVLALFQVNPLWAQAVYGAVILVAVSADGYVRMRLRNASTKRS